ncbi:unnamed protein product [Phytophthora lilii]|uniref:Unnamed protein product n=1 Tax=Phytophthora lilii TaxID=2077276 RepID=A0A9W6WVU6_9STRA|nr:unnamed protein product [Phytophthora lilii]
MSTTPFLRVEFASRKTMSYDNPITWTCMKISTCSNWEESHVVSWKYLSSNQYANFYESDKCVAEAVYHYISDRKSYTSGVFTFNNLNRPIRSMMVGEYSDTFRRPKKTYADKCPSGPESTSIESIAINGTMGDLSSNWYDVLPSTSTSNASTVS